MITVFLHGHNITDNAGYNDRLLYVTLVRDERNDSWVPHTVWAVTDDAIAFRKMQIDKAMRPAKTRHILARLELLARFSSRCGIMVPPDAEWPFSGFDRVAFDKLEPIAIEICQRSQTSDASIIRLWSKP
jgi:hypothetical protein